MERQIVFLRGTKTDTAPREVPLVGAAVDLMEYALRHAKGENGLLPQTVPDVTQAIHAVSDVEFPGYGLIAFGKRDLPDGTSLLDFSVEVPTAAQERLIVYRVTRSC